MRQLLTFLLVLFATHCLMAQLKPALPKKDKPAAGHSPALTSPVTPFRPLVPPAEAPFSQKNKFVPIPHLPVPVSGQPALGVYFSPETQTPSMIEGNFRTDAGKSLEQNVADYISVISPFLKMVSPAEELHFQKNEKEADKSFQHLHFQQKWNGLRVHGAEAKIHLKEGEIYLYNGRTYPTPSLSDATPALAKETAVESVLQDVAQLTTLKELSPLEEKLVGIPQVSTELVVYHIGGTPDGERLAWHITVVPNAAHRYAYFVDAKTGEILQRYSELCHIAGHREICKLAHHNHEAPTGRPLNDAHGESVLDGPATANATDLFGITRLIHTYDVSGTFFMIDASRPMFNITQSSLPGDPVGAVLTLNGQNNSPENNNFQAAYLTSATNTWNNPTAVSAHYHAGLAYLYFKTKFGRESINGQGGTIISLINITEENGSDMDNAFWNGQAMWYGNGDVAFNAPLAKSPDVAGHEMSHGVVQSTANLEYFGESGALNESFADVFGAMIDPDRDFRIGEDIANPSIFPTGALRDMADPHNGGNSLNDNGYQPAHYDERYTGNEDNGGVHINSGIPNKAFQLLAQAIGKDKAEQIYYRALSVYLFRSAKFVDARIAVIQAATDLYGNTEATAAQNAFAAVGIGAGAGTNSQTNSDMNPGDDFVLMTDNNFTRLYIFTPDGTAIADPLNNTSPLSRPSVTDDGSSIVFIASDNTMRAININWQTGFVQQVTIQNEPMWRNVAVSKDGNRLAALTTDEDNTLWIYDFGLAEWKVFDLYNPTTGQGGPTTGDVQYADVLEWDFTGEWVMYDALNNISTLGNSDGIEYWDISFANVWDNSADDFADGFISKLFNGLPENVSVGNPTFSKNSDFIIAFDYIDDFNDAYSLRAANLELNEVGTIFNNNKLSWPNYSVDDTHIVFDAESNTGTPVLAFAPLDTDKISPNGNPFIFLNNRRWGVWFANGERDLVDAGELFAESTTTVFPNPVKDGLTILWRSHHAGSGTLEVFDLLGKKWKTDAFEAVPGEMNTQVDMAGLPAGQYVIRLNSDAGSRAIKVVKN